MKIRFFCNRIALFGLMTGTVVLAGCFGGIGSSPPNYPTNESVTVTPAIASVAVNGTQQFTATGVSTTTVAAWNLNTTVTGMSTGTVTQSGLYTAPATPPLFNYGGYPGKQGTVTVSATEGYACSALFGCATSGSQSFLVTAPSVTTGFVTQANSSTVNLGGQVKLQPYAVGALDQSYTLQVNGVTGGSMSYGTIVQDANNAGGYTAPAAYPMTGKTITITVISNADPTKTANMTITLN